MTNEAWDNYKKNLEKSSLAVWRVAMYLHSFKYTVTIPALHVAQDQSQYKSFIDDGDIILHRDGNKEKIEVKHQSWNWTSHKDIPWESIIVCAKRSYDRHKEKPSAYFLVNQQMSHAILIPSSTYDQWWVEVVHDKKKDWRQTMYKTKPEHHEFIQF